MGSFFCGTIISGPGRNDGDAAGAGNNGDGLDSSSGSPPFDAEVFIDGRHGTGHGAGNR